MADLTQAMGAVAGQPETQIQHFSFPRPKIFHEEGQRFLAFGIRPQGLTFIVGHSFGELEVAVIVENGVEGNGGSSGGLQVSEMFEAAAGSAGKLLRTGEMLAAVSQGLGFLLELPQLLQVVRRQAH